MLKTAKPLVIGTLAIGLLFGSYKLINPSSASAATIDSSQLAIGFHLFAGSLDSLVTNKTITQEQETAIENALKPSGGPNGPGRNIGQNFKTKLDSLVTDGTIAVDQENSLIKALQSGPRGNFKTKLDGMVTAQTITSDQEKAIENALKPSGGPNRPARNFSQNFKTKLDTLVNAGTITQTQENTVIKALQSGMAGHRVPGTGWMHAGKCK